MNLKHVLLVLAAFLAGCASAPPHSASASPTAQMTVLEPLGELFTTTVTVGGTPMRFLVDTGGGITVFAPELANLSGCRLGGPITGFRMSGERMDAPRCEVATVGIAAAHRHGAGHQPPAAARLAPRGRPAVAGQLSRPHGHG